MVTRTRGVSQAAPHHRRIGIGPTHHPVIDCLVAFSRGRIAQFALCRVIRPLQRCDQFWGAFDHRASGRIRINQARIQYSFLPSTISRHILLGPYKRHFVRIRNGYIGSHEPPIEFEPIFTQNRNWRHKALSCTSPPPLSRIMSGSSARATCCSSPAKSASTRRAS